MYCRECDREDVGNWHKCFVRFGNKIRPLKKKPIQNTKLARKMAELYEKHCGEFPNGITNAKIKRLATEGYRDSGAWVWVLRTINNDYLKYSMGSQWTATECAKEFSNIVPYHRRGDCTLIIE